MSKTTKTILWLAAAIIVVGGFWWIMSGQNKTPAANIGKESIKIGVIAPLTGNLASVGKDINEGVSLAAENINKKIGINGKKVELIIEDSKGDPKEGVSAVNKMIFEDRIKYIYCFGTPVINAIKPITEKNKIILAAISLDSNLVNNTDYTFRIFYNSQQFLEKVLSFIENQNMPKVAGLYMQADVLQNEINYWEDNGIKFVAKEQYKMGEQDFRTVLLKIKNANPDYIILLGYGFHYPAVFKQMKELGMDKIKVIGNLGFTEVPKGNENLFNDNSIFLVPSFEASPSRKSTEFIQNYKNKFGYIPSHQAAYAYDIIGLIYQAGTNTNGTTQKVSNYLRKAGKYEGAVGQIEMLSNGDTKSSVSFATYKNGLVVPYNK